MIWIILYILFWHFIADFVAQTDETAKGKATSIKWLTRHILAYGQHLLYGGIPLLILGITIGKNWALPIIIYVSFNMVVHWVVDYFTSKQTSRLWAEGKVHEFFVMIGFDQFLHAASLILSYYALMNI